MANVCNKCGNNLYGNKTKCPFCGEPISARVSSTRSSNRPSGSGSNLSSSSYQNNNTYNGYNSNYQKPSTGPRRTTSSSYDSGSAGWGILGFCFPIVGIILYLVWQNDKPLNAKAALNGALISIVIGFIFGLFSACGQLASY